LETTAVFWDENVWFLDEVEGLLVVVVEFVVEFVVFMVFMVGEGNAVL